MKAKKVENPDVDVVTIGEMPELAIVSLGTADDPKFLINNKVILSGFHVKEDADGKEMVAYNIDFDDQATSQKEAIELADKAATKIFDDINKSIQENGIPDEINVQ